MMNGCFFRVLCGEVQKYLKWDTGRRAHASLIIGLSEGLALSEALTKVSSHLSGLSEGLALSEALTKVSSYLYRPSEALA